ncbi:unnamed protein product [Brugia timori]|uniref:Uncharacterized protein n=1 Tax=Brugia timori TaxID=42155 RepID=A0A0R3QYV6_9BILA|nr:unnamed protein product [Brugia timori]
MDITVTMFYNKSCTSKNGRNFFSRKLFTYFEMITARRRDCPELTLSDNIGQFQLVFKIIMK